ncbi:MAG: FAD-dependent oxidoreductase [Firmicutes bacterium]|nr:FAD-dependent oxidoreductase [Bacillota bacterium]
MKIKAYYDVVIIGAGPAGMAAGISCYDNKASTLIVEREERIGGILKQCIHDGFGVIEFKEKLTGPEYSERYIKIIKDKNIPIITKTFVLNVEKKGNFKLTLINPKEGIFNIETKALILANGCRERTQKQIFIHGSRPSGIFTAGTAQYFVNILGYLPCKRCVILGSGDIGLIMARRLTLEGANVIGVYEAKKHPSGLIRNISQCLNDYEIPIILSHTITKIIGDDRVKAVEISEVNEDMEPILGTEKIIECDGVILSVGLIPENEIAESLNIDIDKRTKGPIIDQNFMTSENGIFSCGNALHVNDLVDYVSESGRYAGLSAARYINDNYERKFISVEKSLKDFAYIVPQYIDIKSIKDKVIFYFRSMDIKENVKIYIKCGENIIFHKKYRYLRPPEMERIEINLDKELIKGEKSIEFIMMEG